MIPVARPDIGPEEIAAVTEVLESGMLAGGRRVAELEERFAAFIGAKHAIAVSNGTVALMCIFEGLGLTPGDEVITVGHTFNATISSILYTGATPVFVDIERDTYVIDAARIEAAITPRTRAICPVHLFGLPADMDMIVAIADRHGLEVVEDACQAHGAERDGLRAGAAGDAAAFSFYPGKNLGAIGDAGALVTDDFELAEVVRALREHGQFVKYEHALQGYTARLDTIQAAVLLRKLPMLDAWNRSRSATAALYRELLAGLGDLHLPSVPPGSLPVWHLFTVRTAHREELVTFLGEAGIGTGRHYPYPPHLCPAYAHLGYTRGAFPVSEAIARESLSLPLYPGISARQVEAVCSAVEEFFGRR
jgi:dTDP-4-amino-4,6-dideoxygalactose transaminase